MLPGAQLEKPWWSKNILRGISVRLGEQTYVGGI